jgi:hypothetical protein
MGFFSDFLKALKTAKAERDWQKKFNKKVIVPPEIISEKDTMTAKGEPWVGILRLDVDPDDLSSGMIELDWNEKFIIKLARAGYKGKDDKAMVDQWFANICTGIITGEYENEIADPDNRKRIQRKQLDDERTEIS